MPKLSDLDQGAAQYSGEEVKKEQIVGRPFLIVGAHSSDAGIEAYGQPFMVVRIALPGQMPGRWHLNWFALGLPQGDKANGHREAVLEYFAQGNTEPLGPVILTKSKPKAGKQGAWLLQDVDEATMIALGYGPRLTLDAPVETGELVAPEDEEYDVLRD